MYLHRIIALDMWLIDSLDLVRIELGEATLLTAMIPWEVMWWIISYVGVVACADLSLSMYAYMYSLG